MKTLLKPAFKENNEKFGKSNFFAKFFAKTFAIAASAGRAERKQCAGVPPPAWLDPAFLEVWAEGPTERGSHVPSRAIELRRTFSSWAPSWLQVRIFSQFVCIFFARCFELRFLSFPDGFWMDFGRFGEDSGGVLEVVFHTIFKKLDFWKNSVFPRENW